MNPYLLSVYFKLQKFEVRQHVMPMASKEELLSKLKKVYPKKNITIERVVPIYRR